ncbi:MAG: nucleotide sugar dehydrogenase [Bdellovibrionales bacterium]|nr:nucleotide sugar dehydrogenase [Bdellovibrionales bacterium]
MEKSTVGVVGMTHLGLVHSISTAAKKFSVVGYDPRTELVAKLREHQFPISEPQLQELTTEHRERLKFSSNVADLKSCGLVFFALDIETDAQNRSNLEPLRELLKSIVPQLSPGTTAVVLSQVTPGFTREFSRWLEAHCSALNIQLYYQVETLIFGRAFERGLHPERYIIGCLDPRAPLPALYRAWTESFQCPVLPMKLESAELAKISINLYLVSTVVVTNTIAEVCEQLGADWFEIAPALRLDRRIGPYAYLSPGLGISGGNLERDLVTIQQLSAKFGTDSGVVDAWFKNSRIRRDWVLKQLTEHLFPRLPRPALAIWGLAYKEDTHSVKNSPTLALLDSLKHCQVKIHDPQAKIPAAYSWVTQVATREEACAGADALVIMTPWKEYRGSDAVSLGKQLKQGLILDPFHCTQGEPVGGQVIRLGQFIPKASVQA